MGGWEGTQVKNAQYLHPTSTGSTTHGGRKNKYTNIILIYMLQGEKGCVKDRTKDRTCCIMLHPL